MTTIQTALAATRLGRNTIRGDRRALLTDECHQIRQQRPALDNGADRSRRWNNLIAAGKTADHNTVAQHRARHTQATVDLDWYQRTSTQLRADAETQHDTITAIRTELSARTTSPSEPPPRPRAPKSAPRPGAHAAGVAQDLITIAPAPPKDTPTA